MEKDELIWVSKEFADKWMKLKEAGATRDQQEAVFNEYMASVTGKVRSDFKANLESLEEDAAIFTGLMLKVKQSFEKAKNEHLNSSYDLWEKFDSEIPSISKKIGALVNTIRPLKDELSAVNSLLSQINTYDIDKVVSSISNLANAYGTQKEMIEFLIQNFNRDAK